MRVLLVCVPRTGSNSFLKALSKALNIHHISIPYSFNLSKNKALIDSTVRKESIIFRISPIHNVGYNLDKFCLLFDKVILLSRLNDEEHYKSLINLYYKENILGFGTNGVYNFNDIPTPIVTQIEQVFNYEEIVVQKKQIENLGLILNQKVLYYEEIFYSDVGLKYLQSTFDTFDSEKYKLYLNQTTKLSITRDKSFI